MRFTAIATTLALTAAVAAADDFTPEALATQCMAQTPTLAQTQTKFSNATRTYKKKSYQKLSRTKKMDLLWNELVPDPTVVQPVQDFMWHELPEAFTDKSVLSYCQAADDLVRHRKKHVHTQGLVAKVEWKPTPDNGLSGIYGTGSDTVIARISEVGKLWEGSSGHAPSIAVKFLIDGVESANVFAQTGFTSTDTWNFFEPTLTSRLYTKKDFKERIPDILLKTLVPKLTEAVNRPFAVNVSLPGSQNNDGTRCTHEEAWGNIPYELHFKAPESVKSKFSSERQPEEWYDIIKGGLKAGDTMYEVYAYTPAYEQKPWKKTPEARLPLEESSVKIADLVLKTDLYTSVWGDTKMLFRHQDPMWDRRYWPVGLRRLDEDMAFDKENPDDIWGHEVPSYWHDEMAAAAKETYVTQTEQYGCPFAWLLGKE